MCAQQTVSTLAVPKTYRECCTLMCKAVRSNAI